MGVVLCDLGMDCDDVRIVGVVIASDSAVKSANISHNLVQLAE